MKRNQNLYPLSWQHHDLLMAVLLLKKGIAKGAAPHLLLSFSIHIWEAILLKHIEVEENVFQFAWKDTALSLYIERITEEHKQLNTLLNAIRNEKGELVTDFIKLLEQHIRYEEREFFPMLEKVVSTEKIHEIGSTLSTLEKSSCLNYPHRFWE